MAEELHERRGDILFQEDREAEEAAPSTPEENVARGREAMERVLTRHTDALNAMFRPEVGGISFYWGRPGQGKKPKKGEGISHLIARRNAEGEQGEAIARKMVEVIAYGNVTKEQKAEGGDRISISHDGHTAVLSLYRFGNRETWLLTGWKDHASDAVPKVYDSDTATHDGSTRFQSDMGAEAEGNISPTGADGKPLFQRYAASPRGSISFRNGRTLIRIFRDSADLSTFLHEAAHLFIKQLEDLVATGKASPRVVADLRALQTFTAEYADGSDAARLEEFYTKVFRPGRPDFAERDFRSLSPAEVKRVGRIARHEKSADGFVTYMREGKAPSPELQSAFRRFRRWLTGLYQSAMGDVVINDEIRAVFDRMLAAEADVALAEAKRRRDSASEPPLPSGRGGGLPLPVDAPDDDLYHPALTDLSDPRIIWRKNLRTLPPMPEITDAAVQEFFGDTAPISKNYKWARKKAKETYQSNSYPCADLAREPWTPDTRPDEQIWVSSDGIDEILKRASDADIASMALLPEIFRNMQWFRNDPDVNAKHPQQRAIQAYAPVRIGDKHYAARVVLKRILTGEGWRWKYYGHKLEFRYFEKSEGPSGNWNLRMPSSEIHSPDPSTENPSEKKRINTGELSQYRGDTAQL